MLGHGSLLWHSQILVVLGKVTAIWILAQKCHAGHEGILHGFIIRIHNWGIQSGSQAHGKEGAVNQRTVWHTKGNIAKAHGGRIAVFLSVEAKGFQGVVAGICISSYGHNQAIQQEISFLQASLLSSGNNGVHNLQAALGGLWYAIISQRQAKDGSTVFPGQRDKFLQPFHLGTDGVN